MKRLLIALLLISNVSYAQTTRDVQKKAARQTANVETITAHKVLTYLDAETQLITPSGGSYNVTLPSTNVWAGWVVKIVNSDAANTLTIKSSDGDTLDVLAAVGRVEFVAKQTSPTDTLHWVNLSKIGTLGVTDGSSACVGCVGEVIQLAACTRNVSTPVASTWYDVPQSSPDISVTAGEWEVTAAVQCYLGDVTGVSAPTTKPPYISFRVYNTTDASVVASEGLMPSTSNSGTGVYEYSMLRPNASVKLTATKQMKVQMMWNSDSATKAGVGVLGCYENGNAPQPCLKFRRVR